MENEKLDEILAKHKLWLDDQPGGERADLTGADLTRARLTGADFDFASFPLWCGGSYFKASPRLLWQLLAHAYTLIIDDPEAKEAQAAILKYARKSHRADDLKIPREED